MGKFSEHTMGKNHISFCQKCKIKEECQNVKRTYAEKSILGQSDPVYCLFYLIISSIMEDNW